MSSPLLVLSAAATVSYLVVANVRKFVSQYRGERERLRNNGYYFGLRPGWFESNRAFRNRIYRAVIGKHEWNFRG